MNFRAGLIRALQQGGFRVAVAAGEDDYVEAVHRLADAFLPLPVDSSGVSPVRDGKLLAAYVRAFLELRPFAYLGFTAKPNIYGSLAAQITRTKTINNISGLGTVFINRSRLTSLVETLYRVALRRSVKVFFQNEEDRRLFLDRKLVDRSRTELLPGSGVDLGRFRPVPLPSKSNFLFLMAARLLWDKGVGEFVEAARMVRTQRKDVFFRLVGPLGVDNRTAVPRAQVEAWEAERLIDYRGRTDDVREFIAEADCVVLPSYREGLPRILLEAAAMGRPVIATDVPGCRDALVSEETGLLCEARSPHSLAKTMLEMIDLAQEDRERMGRNGRARVERNFAESLVFEKYLQALGADDRVGDRN